MKADKKPYDNSPSLIQAINKYGRQELHQATKISPSMINQVCANYRGFSTENARLVAEVLDLPFSVCLSRKSR